MLIYTQGNIFDLPSNSYLVNPVNTVGTMGTGLALQFAKNYPDLLIDYQEACEKNELLMGHLYIHTNHDTKHTIINLPIKNHWKDQAEYSYIQAGLNALAEYIKITEPFIVGIPALGCDSDGLNWLEVKAIMNNFLNDEDIKDTLIIVFKPKEFKND